jgi:ribosome biogenesis GTPase
VSSALPSLGWDAFFAESFQPFSHTHVPARVARVDRGEVDCLIDGGSVRARVRPGDEAPATGDWVALVDDAVGWSVDAVLPRRTSMQRAAASGRSEAQVLAANVDVVLVVVPVFPEPKPGLTDRFLALAWDSGATPVVVVTKADLTAEAAAIAADVTDSAPGVDVLLVSAATGLGLDELRDRIEPGSTVCLLGRSGAGKSTLVNALAGSEVLQVDNTRRDGKGRHTTTHRELVPIPGGGVLLDTPGLRGAGVWVGEEGLGKAFSDIDELVELCRFSDCAHDTEPGCAVLEAVDDGRVAERRLASWRKLQREARWIATRHDARVQAENRRQWKILHLEVRRSGRIRP